MPEQASYFLFSDSILQSCITLAVNLKHGSYCREKNGQLMKAVACPHATSLAESPNEMQASDQPLSFTYPIPEVKKPC